MVRKKTNGWAVFGALGAIGYLAYREAKRKKIEQQNQHRKIQDQQIQKNELVKPPPVSEEEIKKLYHELARKYHPDFAQNDNDKQFRTELFKKIKDAYDRRDINTLKLYKLD